MKLIGLFVLLILITSMFGIKITKADTEVPSGKLDFNSGASPTQSGWTGFDTNEYVAGTGYGWTDAAETPIEMANVDRGSGSGGALDDLEQEIHYGALERWFKICVPNGVYDYTWYYGDNGYAHGPFTITDNDGVEVTGLSTNGSEWKHYHGTVTVASGFLYIKIIPQVADNMAHNGVEWSQANLLITTTNTATGYTTISTTASTTTTISAGTSTVVTTKTGGTSIITTTCTTTSGTGGTTVSVIISQIVTSSISQLNSITDPAAGTLTGFETTTTTISTSSTISSTFSTTSVSTSVTTTTTETTTTFAGLWENYNINDNDWWNFEGIAWYAQSFTVGAVGHNINSVRLLMYRNNDNAPLELVVSIKAVDVNGHPTGPDLTVGAIDGMTFTTDPAGLWYQIPLTEYTLSANTKYAIVCRTLEDPGTDNQIMWRCDSNGGYADGSGEYTSNSGSTWYTETEDFMFEVWGESYIITETTSFVSTQCETTCETFTETSIYSSTSSTTICETSINSSTSSTTICDTITDLSTYSTTTCHTHIEHETETITDTSTITGTESSTITETTITTSCMTALVSSTETTAITCATIGGTSTSTEITATTTQHTSTSVVGVIGGGGFNVLIIILFVAVMIIFAVAIFRRR